MRPERQHRAGPVGAVACRDRPRVLCQSGPGHRRPLSRDEMLTQIYIHFGVALAGLASFLSPCVLPLVPPYLTYLGGTTLDQLTGKEEIDAALWRRVVL